jgi:hypothetical protein
VAYETKGHTCEGKTGMKQEGQACNMKDRHTERQDSHAERHAEVGRILTSGFTRKEIQLTTTNSPEGR